MNFLKNSLIEELVQNLEICIQFKSYRKMMYLVNNIANAMSHLFKTMLL